jgi:hypothetical protein
MSGIHLALLGMTYGGGVTVIQSFTATGEWVCPTGVTEVEYLVVAGGAGGGGGVRWPWRGWSRWVQNRYQGFLLPQELPYTVTVGAGGPGS